MNWLSEWKTNRREHERKYREFSAYANERGFCWACGRTGSYRDKPKNWFAPWLIHRAHIVNKPRLEDRRCVNLLCPICHDIADGRRAVDRELTTANMLFLKQLFDPTHFDLVLLQRCSVRKLPGATDLSAAFLLEFQQRRGLTRSQIAV